MKDIFLYITFIGSIINNQNIQLNNKKSIWVVLREILFFILLKIFNGLLTVLIDLKRVSVDVQSTAEILSLSPSFPLPPQCILHFYFLLIRFEKTTRGLVRPSIHRPFILNIASCMHFRFFSFIASSQTPLGANAPRVRGKFASRKRKLR